MTLNIVQKSRIKSFCLVLGFGVIASLFIYYISDTLGCDKIPIDLSNATSIQLSKQYQQTCYSMDSNGKILSYLIPFVGLAFWFMIDTKVRKISKEIDESIKKQGGRCFICEHTSGGITGFGMFQFEVCWLHSKIYERQLLREMADRILATEYYEGEDLETD